MTDLLRVLPHFAIGQYASLLPTLEKHNVSTSELITLDVADIGKRTQLPLPNLKRLRDAVLAELHRDLGVASEQGPPREGEKENNPPATARSEPRHKLKHDFASLSAQWQTISTLDPEMDCVLGGGVPTGYVTEVTGESGTGKTQFLLSLLLAVQLPPPYGLGRPALYISTEAALSTKRLAQILANNPLLNKTAPSERPTLDNIISTATPDLESQDHILTFQVPVEVARRNIGLIVLDSVAANFRAEFERNSLASGPQQTNNMAARSTDLVRLGMLLRDLAQKHNLAVVVANQVADRFGGSKSPAYPASGQRFSSTQQQQQQQQQPHQGLSSPLAARSIARGPMPVVEPTSSIADAVPRSSMAEPSQDQRPDNNIAPPLMHPPSQASHPALLLDHQQRWFTGWGDDPDDNSQQKTPSLGLVWTTQIASRIALFRRPAYGRSRYSVDDDEPHGMPTLRSWRRWMKLVFAPHVPGTGPGLEGAVQYEVTMGGLKAVEKGKRKGDNDGEEEEQEG
ncbi:DNA repair protein RAD57 [Coniochaeta sp. 2T2.1]|nr:DNA repair protein RAD57 [Coniochaeta sp. 2T2.1]